jgi:hypothetical protein
MTLRLTKERCDHCGKWVAINGLYTLEGVVIHPRASQVAVCKECCNHVTQDTKYWLKWLDGRER